MRLLHPRLWIVALILTSLLGTQLAPMAAAQEATPMAAECTGPKADAEHLLSLWFDADHNPVATPETPGLQAVTGPEVTLQMGKPANAATIAGVTETVTAVFNCFVAGDFLGALAYFTDDLIASSFGPESGVTYEQAEEFLNTPPEPDPDQSTLVSVANVMDLDNGQAGAFVIERRPNGEDIASYGTFVKEGDLWKVDKIYDFPSADDSNG
jgi:hypothetical protein